MAGVALEGVAQAVDGSTARGIGDRRIRQSFAWIATPVTIFLGTRAALWVLAYASAVFLPHSALLPVRPYVADNLLLDAWTKWDAINYLVLADEGYWFDHTTGISSAPVGPLYPALVSLSSHVLGNTLVAGLLVANFCLAAGLVILYRLVADLLGDETAARTTMLLCLLPYAFLLGAAYPHSLALLSICLCLTAIRRGRFFLAGLSAALAALTLPAGLALWPALLAAIQGKRGVRDRAKAVPALALLPAALGIFIYYLHTYVGQPLSTAAQAALGWNSASVLAWLIDRQTPSPFALTGSGLALSVHLAVALLAFLAVPIVIRLLGIPQAVFTATLLLLSLTGSPAAVGPNLLLAVPVIAAVAFHLRHETIAVTTMGVSALFLGILTAGFVSFYDVWGGTVPPPYGSTTDTLAARYRAQGLMPPHELLLEVDGDILILGHDYTPGLYRPGEEVPISVEWHALRPSKRLYVLSTHLVDRHGKRWGITDRALFESLDGSGQMHPTLPGEHYGADLTVTLAPGVPSGVYTLELVANELDPFSLIYRKPSVRRIDGSPVERMVLGWTIVGRPQEVMSMLEASPQHSLRASFGVTVQLLGYDLEARALGPNQDLAVSLYWGARTKPDYDYTVFVQLLDAEGKLVAQSDAYPLDNRFPTSYLESGVVIRDTHRLRLDSRAGGGPYRLIAGLYRLDTMQRLPVQMDEADQLSDHLNLGLIPSAVE